MSALEVAITQLDVREVPPGSNRGPEVDQYVRSVGLDPAGAYPWCMCFIYWCFEKHWASHPPDWGAPNRCPRTGSALGLWNLSPDSAKGHIVPGAVFVMDFGHGTGHVGFVESVDGAWLTTIEGNTNVAGQREGIGVFRRKRAVASINKGFLYFG